MNRIYQPSEIPVVLHNPILAMADVDPSDPAKDGCFPVGFQTQWRVAVYTDGVWPRLLIGDGDDQCHEVNAPLEAIMEGFVLATSVGTLSREDAVFIIHEIRKAHPVAPGRVKHQYARPTMRR